MPDVMLEVNGLSKNFGGLAAVSDLSLTIRRGEIFGVIGPNGAGKTTLLNLITGYLAPSKGSILFEGRELRGLSPSKICHRGIARTFQVVRPFVEMSDIDNVMTGALFAPTHRISMAEARIRAGSALDLVGLLDKRDMLAGELTIGEKKKLELARALATKPRLLFLDEVMAGLAGGEVEVLMDVVERVADSGTTVLVIEHLVGVILALTDRVLVPDFGRELFQGAPEDVVAHPEVIDSYLGKPLDQSQMVR
jgi:ABC-type branched-subunit amino acid transport system ATPase component